MVSFREIMDFLNQPALIYIETDETDDINEIDWHPKRQIKYKLLK